MAAKLDVVKIEQTDAKTTISWHRYNTDNTDNDSSGSWEVDGNLTPDECVAYAKTMIEPGQEIEVSLNLQ